jgi:large subunit ribosomal protein L27
MSKIAAAGSVTISNNVAGKRLGIKKYAGEKVKTGNIILKQRGTVHHPGKNVKLSKDFSIYAMTEGVVAFRRMSGRKRGKYYVDVIPHDTKATK